VLVRVQPEAPSRARPTGEAAVFQAVPGEFDSRSPLAGSIQAARSTSCSSSRQGTRSLTPDNTGSTPVHDTARLRRLMDQDLRLRISGWWFESTRSHSHRPRSGITLVSKSDQRGSIPRRPATRQAAHLVVRSVSYAERAGFDPLACYDHGEQSPGGDRSLTCCRRRVRFPGSLPRVPLAQRQV
jgi:hypothetical protein